MEAVRVINLKVSYAETTVIERMNLVVPEGKISIIIGANGCGKSTLLKTMARILKPSDGEIYIGGENIKIKGDCEADGISAADTEMSGADYGT